MDKSFAFILPHYYKFYRGGAETQCYYIAQQLIKNGWKVYYVFEHSEVYKAKNDNGILLYTIPKKKGYLKWQNSKAIYELMKEINASVWYTRANISYLRFLVKYAKSISTTGKVAWAFSRDSQFVLKDNEQNQASLPVKLYNRFNKKQFFKALKETDHILLQTEKQSELLETNLRLKGKIIYNAHPEVNSDNVQKRKRQVLWIGRFRPFKRPDRFIKIAKILGQSGIQFKMVGKYKEEDLQNFMSGLSHINNLEILGEKQPEEVHSLLNESLLLINTSEYEGFSNTFIEAWQRGVPVFSVEVDPDNMINNFDLGKTNQDLNELAEEIKYIIDNKSIWEQFSEKCKSHAKKNFDISEAVKKLEEVLIEV